MYTSSVLSWTIAPCGHAAPISSPRASALPGRPGQRGEQAKLGRSERPRRAVARDGVLGRVEREAEHGDLAGLGRRAAQQRAQPDDDLLDVKRLGDVVIAAGVEAGQAIGQRVARGQEQHRREHAAGAHRLAEVAAVGVGQADVDDERVGRAMCGDVRERVDASRYSPAPKPSARKVRTSTSRRPASSSTISNSANSTS